MTKLRWTVLLLLVAIAVTLVLVTVLPVIESNLWWIRVWDFPRVLISFAASVVLAALIVASPGLRHWSSAVSIVLAIALVFQCWRIAPYTLLWQTDMVSTTHLDINSCVSVLVANVFMENRRSDTIRQLIADEQPDIALILETDNWWSKALKETSDNYTSVIDEPLDNTYGLLFMTQLESDGIELRHLSSPNIPSIRASLRLPSGAPFTFIGLHPEPPRIGQDTDLRDHELTVTANEIRDNGGSFVVGGDLNDVAWSHTTRVFKRISQMLDPRRGRGLYASYHADYALFRWPLDHLFATTDFQISRLAVLPYTGSDHFPVLAEFCQVDGARQSNDSAEDMQGDDRQEMREILQSE